jgi:uncharacterized membrane protein YfcA
MDFIATLDALRWISLAVAASLIGLAKAGLDGGALIAAPLIAALFGAKASSGILLGVLITADLVAVWSYRKAGSPTHLIRTLPWALAGILLGTLVGGAIPDRAFRSSMSALILLCASLMAVRELRGGRFTLPERWWVAAPLGLLAGFASMVGNVAGPIMGLFLLSSGLPKTAIVGTSVWFFCIVNLAKVPLHVFVWHTVTGGTLLADLIVAPITILATLFGVRLVRLIPEKPYRIFMIVIACIGGLYLGLR